MSEFSEAYNINNQQVGLESNPYIKWLHEDSSSSFKDELLVPIGVGQDGLFCYNFKEIPHLLVSGSPGSGKTSFVEALIAELMESNSPDNVQFLVFDSRGSEYTFIDANPFFVKPPTDDITELRYFLQWIINKGEERRSTLDINTIDKSSPDYFIILDDCAVVTRNTWAIEMLSNIIYNGRISKIHLIIVTSTPDGASIPTKIRDSIPCRVAFNVPSRSTSRMLLNMSGAENLCVPGEIYFKTPKVVEKMQAVYLSDDELETIMFHVMADYVSFQALEKLGAISASIMGKAMPFQSNNPNNNSSIDIAKDKAKTELKTIPLLEEGYDDSDNNSFEEGHEDETVKSEYEDMPDIPLTPQPKIIENDFFVKVENNELVVGKRVINTTSSNIMIKGKYLKGFKHHKASLFKEGYISIEIPLGVVLSGNSKVPSIDKSGEIATKMYENELKTGVIKIPYGISKERQFSSFVNILSKDTGIKVIEE